MCIRDSGRFELEKLAAAGVDISYYPVVAGAKDLTAGSMKVESETDLPGGDVYKRQCKKRILKSRKSIGTSKE